MLAGVRLGAFEWALPIHTHYQRRYTRTTNAHLRDVLAHCRQGFEHRCVCPLAALGHLIGSDARVALVLLAVVMRGNV